MIKKKLLCILGLDVLFLLLYGYIRGGIFGKVADYLIAIQLDLRNIATYDELARQALGVGGFFERILILIVLFMIFIYLVYSITQGLGWRILFKDKKGYMRYFFLINIILVPVYLVFMSLHYLDETLGLWYIWIVNLAFIILMLGFMILYSLGPQKNLWSKAYRKSIRVFKDKIILGLILLIIMVHFITVYLPVLTVVLGIMLILPSIALIKYRMVSL